MMNLDEAIQHCKEKAKELREKAKIYKGQFLWERDAEYCQKCAEEHEQLAEWLKELKALKERPQSDLISRSEAEKLGATCLAKRNENGQLEAIISLDNAPTVEPTTKPMVEVKFDKEQMQELVDKAKAEVLASIERPQGEWIYHEEWENEGGCGYECPRCGRTYDYDMNFCGYCGLRMKGNDTSIETVTNAKEAEAYPINQEENCNIVCDFIRDITGIDIRKEKKHERMQDNLADEVWKLYEKYQPHLATSVIEFGDELKELLIKYMKQEED